jgi:hypothetical protein
MNPEARSVGERLQRAAAQTLLVAGAVMFFFGDKLLREVCHVGFATAESIGIGGGLTLATLGAVLKPAAEKKAKSVK